MVERRTSCQSTSNASNKLMLLQINNPRSGESHVRVDWRAHKLLQPTASEVEDANVIFYQRFSDNFPDYLLHGDSWNEPHHTSLRNLLLQLHSLQEVTSLQGRYAREHGPFDVVIAVRSDLWFFNKLNIDHVRAAMQSNATVYTPAFDTWGGLNDRFAIGHPDAMHRVMNRLNDALAYSADNPLHSETFLKHVVEMHGLSAANTDLVFERVRGNGFLQKVPELRESGGLGNRKPGRWLKLNSLAMWELSGSPPGYSGIDDVMRAMARLRQRAFC